MKAGDCTHLQRAENEPAPANDDAREAMAALLLAPSAPVHVAFGHSRAAFDVIVAAGGILGSWDAYSDSAEITIDGVTYAARRAR